MGGAGSACVEALLESGVMRPVLQLGLPDRFIDHGDPAKLLAACGLDAAGITKSIRERFLSSGAVGGQASVKRVA
jgi:1-deoxy-D-xylulose-5-phosphate synthase